MPSKGTSVQVAAEGGVENQEVKTVAAANPVIEPASQNSTADALERKVSAQGVTYKYCQ
jgi:hypothetical protein